jgi:hypothetical protein
MFSRIENGMTTGAYPIFIKAITIIGCLPLLKQLGINSVLGQIGMVNLSVIGTKKRTDEMLMDLVRCVLDVIKQFVSANSGGMSFSQFSASVSTLVQYESSRSYGDVAVPGCMDNIQYLNLLSQCIHTQGVIFASFGSRSQSERNDYTFLFRTLDGLARRYNASKGDKDREEPFVIGIIGQPGTGKTDIAKMLICASLECLGHVGMTSENIYCKNGERWWDGLNNGIHRAVLMDEFACMKKDVGAQVNLASFQNILIATSGAPFQTPQSVAENKAGVYLKADVFALLSNSVGFGASDYVQHMDAFGRRFAVVFDIAKVKDHYRSDTHTGIDTSKVPPDAVDLVDINVLVYQCAQKKFIPVNNPDSSPLVITTTQAIEYTRQMAAIHLLNRKAMANRASHPPHRPVQDLPGQLECLLAARRPVPPPDVVITAQPTSSLGETLAMASAVPGVLMLTAAIKWRQPNGQKSNMFSMFVFDCVNFFRKSVGAILWISIIGGCRFLCYFLEASVFKYAMTMSQRRLAASSVYFSQVLSYPKSFDDCLTRCEDRFLSRFIDVSTYRGLLRALEILVLCIGGYSVVRRITRKTPGASNDQGLVDSTTGVEVSSSPHHPVLTSANFGQEVALTRRSKSVWTTPSVYLPFGPSTCNEGKIMEIALANVVLIRTGKTRFYATCVVGNYYMYASHCNIFENTDISVYMTKDGPSGPEFVTVYNGTLVPGMVSAVNAETSIIYIPGVAPRRSVLPWMMATTPEMPRIQYVTRTIDFEGSLPVVDKGVGDVRVYTTGSFTGVGLRHVGSRNSYHGRCGLPVIVQVGKQTVMAGVIVAGVVGTLDNFASLVSADECRKAMSRISAGPAVPTSGMDFADTLESLGMDSSLPVSRVYHSHFQPNSGTGEFLAIDPRKMGSTIKAQIFNAPCSEDVYSSFPGTRFAWRAPNMGHTRVDGVYMSKETHALRALNANYSRGINVAVMDEVAAHLTKKWVVHCDPQTLHVITVDTACRGTMSLAHVNSIRRQSSVGFPHKGRKGEYMIPGPSSDAPDGYIINDVIREAVDNNLSSFSKGERSNSVWTSFAKLEPVSETKSLTCNTRIISSGEFSLLVIMKALFGMATDVMLSKPLLFETVCGLNCFSTDWADFAKLHAGGYGVINSDFKAYDKTIPSIVMQYVFTVLIGLCRVWYKDWSDEVEQIARGVMTECSFPIFHLDGHFIGFAASNPSGQWLTLICNGVAQSLMLRYIYVKVRGGSVTESLGQFEKDIVFSSLGDDGTMTMHGKPVLTQPILVEQYALLGLTYTDANKGVQISDYDAPGTNTIGKRHILYSEGRVLCPMEFKAIGKMLTTAVDDTAMPVADKMRASFEAGACEFAMYGRAYYDTNISRLREIAVKYSYSSPRFENCTFDSIIGRFDSAVLTPHIPSDEGDVVE